MVDAAGSTRYAYPDFGALLSEDGGLFERKHRMKLKRAMQISKLTLLVVLLASSASFASAFYDAGMGRWINRDPVYEHGGVNLYAFVANSTPNATDLHGLALTGCCWCIMTGPCHRECRCIRFDLTRVSFSEDFGPVRCAVIAAVLGRRFFLPHSVPLVE